jgi:L-phenylalanine/L-methionine N-acetyltransferase
MTDITIRAIEVSDWEALYALQQCPKVRRGTLNMPYRSAADTQQRLEKALALESLYRLVAIEVATGRLVGVITLSQQTTSRQHVGQLGMYVHDDYQGQGIGSRLLAEVLDIADRWLALKRLELTVFTDNPSALHLYKKFGFVIEGTLKKYAFRAGNYLDAYTMARIV